jgi:homoserine kinase
MSQFTVQVPATTANLGPGFDCLGAALTLYNYFTFDRTDTTETQITVKGKEAEKVSTGKDNLLYQSFLKLYEHLGQTPPNVAIKIDLGVALARGLGSSATAIVGGLVGANQLAGNPLSKEEVMRLAIAIEGHPDNVVPALIGNCQLSIADGEAWQICPIPWNSEIIPVLAIPNFELSTEEARSVLPREISRGDAIFNMAHLGLLLRGLETAQGDWLKAALDDKIHQPYRQALIKGYQIVREAALAAGAYGMVISGAGPTLLGLAQRGRAERVASAMEKTWQSQGVETEVHLLSIDTQGARVS